MQQVSPWSGGEMGRLIRDHDWAETALGPMDGWPAALRAVIDIALSSRAQIVIFWGPEYVALYNDPYIPTIGVKHPEALGRPAVENWFETWDVLKPLLDEVRETGEPFWAGDHPFLLERHGFLEETYFDVSYSPIRMDDGTVGGVLCLVSETTGRVLGERAMRTLSRVNEATSGRTTREEVVRATVSALTEARDGIPFAIVYLAEDLDEDGAGDTGGDGVRDGAGTGGARTGGAGAGLRLAAPNGTAPERIGADDFLRLIARDRTPGTPEISEAVRGDGAAGIAGTTGRGGAAGSTGVAGVIEVPGERFGARGPAVAVPITSGTRVQGLLVCGVNPLRRPYGEFFEVLAASVSRALSAAEVHERERRQARALSQLDAAKTAFFANISHELRTPLTLILGPLEELLEDPSIGPEQGMVLLTARRNAIRLLTLLDDVLDFTSFDAGRTRAYHQPTDLVAQTGELASVFRSSAESVGLTLHVESQPLPEAVFLDRRMWERIMFNLLSNAVKHTFTGGVTVGVRSGGDHAVVTVSDTGSGIPENEIPNLFERFHRVPGSPARSHEGTGIGLALVRELITLHGGRIEVDSLAGEGTTFTISLPYGSAHLPPGQIGGAATPYEPGTGHMSYWLPVPDEPTGAPASVPATTGPSGPGTGTVPEPGAEAETGAGAETGPGAETGAGHILVADDNEDLRRYLVRLLSPYWTVTAVADGAAALEAARELVPDVIVADVMMPRMDGLELVRRLRADPATRSVPIMLLSARAGQEESLTGLTAGADEYLVKPFSARELLTRVRGVLRLSAARSRHNRQLRELTEAALAINKAPSAAEVLTLAERYGGRLADAPEAKVTFTSDEAPGRDAAPGDGPGGDSASRPSDSAAAPEGGPSGAAGAPEAGPSGPAGGTGGGRPDSPAHPGGEALRIVVSGGDAGEVADDTVLRQLAQLTWARLQNLEKLALEHRIATTLQLALLPEVPEIEGTSIVGRYVPGNDEASVGGDWYDVIRISDEEVVLVIGDIVGKGVKAAASMGRMRNALRAYALEDPDPGRTLGRLNRMTTGRHDRMHATVLCVRLSLATGNLEYASAGHPPVLVCTPDGEAAFLGEGLAPLIGAIPSAVFPTGKTRLEQGDRLLLYTDGIVESRSRDIMSGMNRLREEMARTSELSLGAMLESLLTLVEDGENRDDVALLGFARA